MPLTVVGNYTLGLDEQLIFPEIDYDQVDKVRGMEITIVTTAVNDDQARTLLTKLACRSGKDSMASKCMEYREKRRKYPNQVVNRCRRCGRPRGYIRKFGLCRICFRNWPCKGKFLV